MKTIGDWMIILEKLESVEGALDRTAKSANPTKKLSPKALKELAQTIRSARCDLEECIYSFPTCPTLIEIEEVKR